MTDTSALARLMLELHNEVIALDVELDRFEEWLRRELSGLGVVNPAERVSHATENGVSIEDVARKMRAER